jgi:APA family basic amino acid/polyamine antiporter
VSTAEHHHAKRQLTLIDCLGIGINGIVGSGIFFLPAALWRSAGGRGPLAWLIVGSLCCLVALCFAEAASRTDRSGGPYRYACDAFGPYVGFGIGWVTLLSTILGYAAVARGFGITAAGFIGQGGHTSVEILLSCMMVGGLCAINILGVRSSARTGDVISAIKILSLVLFLLVGMFFVKLANLSAPPQPASGEQVGLLAAAFAGLFACTGFEYIPVPAGEAQNPRRTIPLAMVISVLASTALYALVQLVATGVHPALGTSETPLVDAVGSFAGQRGRKVMEVAALISSFGFCASSALVGPRYLEAFAEDGFVPTAFMRRLERWGTPALAVAMLSALVTGLLVSGLKFQRLADVSNVAVVVQYVATCVAVLVLRRKAPTGKQGFVIPFGPLVPCLALGGCLAFLQFVGPFELKLAAVMITVGLVLGAINRSAQAARAKRRDSASSSNEAT